MVQATHTNEKMDNKYKVKKEETYILIDGKVWASKTQEKTSGNSGSGSIPAKVNAGTDGLIIN